MAKPYLLWEISTGFQHLAEATEYVTQGGVEHARRLLSKSLGPDASRRIIERVLHGAYLATHIGIGDVTTI